MDQCRATECSQADRLAVQAPTGSASAGRGASVSIDDDRPGPRVFVVDDNDGLRGSIRELLADAAVEVVGEAVDGLDALRKIPSAAYLGRLVVLMDVRLPGPVNGIEATRLLLDRCQRIAVIVFTAFPGAGIERAARQAGAVDLLTKGCPAVEIVDAITREWSRMAPVGN
jgi:DNA-binding NarL/FixJ family response regulator